MKVVSALRRAARERILYPIAGRVVDRCFRWFCGQDEWESTVSGVAHAMIEASTALAVRATVAEVIRDGGPYLGSDSIKVLRLVDEIAQKHSPEVN